ncbi:MAG: hypothetical protein K6G89_05165 [Clostridia bacterium]|nr:hypothetical protein [Clostridia bacterium]
MNVALKEWSAANGNAVPADVTVVAQILAERGYNASNWITLTTNYRVYWCQARNEMVLYNYVTTEVEYPDGYTKADMMGETDIGKTIVIFNAAQLDVPYVSLSLASTSESVNSSNTSEFVSNLKSVSQTQLSSGVVSPSESANISEISTLLSNSETRELFFGSNSNVYVYGTKELTSGGTTNYASLQILSVGESSSANAEFTNSGDVRENFYYLSIYGDKNDVSAQKAAGNYVFNLFSKISAGSINDDVTIVLEPGLTIDCSEVSEWTPAKTFSGYFGTTDSTKEVTMKNISLSSQTGFNQCVHFDGSDTATSFYCTVGVFGAIYGNTTIENIKFSGIKIKDPAIDAAQVYSQSKAYNRNIVAIIGGITDGSFEVGDIVANVSVKNIEVDNTCYIEGVGCASGLVGYIGAARNTRRLEGEVHIEDCVVAAHVTSSFPSGGNSYGAVGGLISCVYRTSPGGNTIDAKYYSSTRKDADNNVVNVVATKLNPFGARYFCPVYIENCTVNAVLKGGNNQAPVVADMGQGAIVFEGTNDFTGATMDGKRADGSANKKFTICNYTGSEVVVMSGSVLKFSSGTTDSNDSYLISSKITSGSTVSTNNYFIKALSASKTGYENCTTLNNNINSIGANVNTHLKD